MNSVHCRKSILLVLLTVSIVASVAVPSAPAEEIVPRFEQTKDMNDLPARWAPLMKELMVPGLAVAVVKDGKLYAVGAYGKRDVDQKLPVTDDTMFYIASITKTYTAFLICKLAEEGELSLDDPIRKHLPRFKLVDPAATDSLTIRDLLTHRAGLQSIPIVTLDAFTGEITEDRYYHWLEQIKPNPKTTYSNIHFTLLGRIAESVTGKSWRDSLRDSLFVPAGMKRTTGYASLLFSDPDHADPLTLRSMDQHVLSEVRKADSTMHAAGGLATSVLDAGRWLSLNLQNGELNHQRLLSAELARDMKREQAKYSRAEGSTRIMTGHGLAWETGTFQGRPFLQHGGGYGGTSAYVALLPEQKSGFFILMNMDGPAQGLGTVIAIDLLNRLTGENALPDLFSSTMKRIGDIKKKGPSAIPAPSGGPLAVKTLSAAPANYVGTYKNSHWGTLRVEQDGDFISVSLGQVKLRMKPKGSDAFLITGPALEGAEARFETPASQPTTRVHFKWQPVGEFIFDR